MCRWRHVVFNGRYPLLASPRLASYQSIYRRANDEQTHPMSSEDEHRSQALTPFALHALCALFADVRDAIANPTFAALRVLHQRAPSQAKQDRVRARYRSHQINRRIPNKMPLQSLLSEGPRWVYRERLKAYKAKRSAGGRGDRASANHLIDRTNERTNDQSIGSSSHLLRLASCESICIVWWRFWFLRPIILTNCGSGVRERTAPSNARCGREWHEGQQQTLVSTSQNSMVPLPLTSTDWMKLVASASVASAPQLFMTSRTYTRADRWRTSDWWMRTRRIAAACSSKETPSRRGGGRGRSRRSAEPSKNKQLVEGSSNWKNSHSRERKRLCTSLASGGERERERARR